MSGPPRELALDMNRSVIANGKPDADGASGLDAAGRMHEIATRAVVAGPEGSSPRGDHGRLGYDGEAGMMRW